MPVITQAAASCPKLWLSAEAIPISIYPVFFENLNKKYITTVLNIPPAKLITKAVGPLVTPAKSAFISVTAEAGTKPMEEAANIVAMFEKPAFAPGGIKAETGISPSRKDSVSATADSIANNVILYVDFFIPLISQ